MYCEIDPSYDQSSSGGCGPNSTCPGWFQNVTVSPARMFWPWVELRKNGVKLFQIICINIFIFLGLRPIFRWFILSSHLETFNLDLGVTPGRFTAPCTDAVACLIGFRTTLHYGYRQQLLLVDLFQCWFKDGLMCCNDDLIMSNMELSINGVLMGMFYRIFHGIHSRYHQQYVFSGMSENGQYIPQMTFYNR